MRDTGHIHTRQLPLDFPHRPDYSADAFLPTAANAAARRWLGGSVPWPAGRLALWGGAGAGKTHLLHVWAAVTGATIRSGREPPPERWPTGPLAIDDADASPDSEALLHVLNAAAEAVHPVLLAARTPPARWPCPLPDLASRLRAMPAVEIGPADDAFLAELFTRLAAARPVVVPAHVQSWLLARLPRSPGVIQHAVALLDRAALAAGAAVTRPLAATALAALLVDDESPSPPLSA